MVGKPSCNYTSDTGTISSEDQTLEGSLYCWTNSVFHPSEVEKWVPCNTVANNREFNDVGCSYWPPLVEWLST